MVPGFTETNIFALYSYSLMPKQFFLPTSPPHHLRFKGSYPLQPWSAGSPLFFFLRLFWNRTVGDKFHGYLGIGCPSCHPNNSVNCPGHSAQSPACCSKPGIERIQALADISHSALCCYSNETRALIANPPNSAQLGGHPYYSPTYIRVHAVVLECGDGQTDRHTDRQTHVTNIHFVSSMTHAKCNKTTHASRVSILISYYCNVALLCRQLTNYLSAKKN